MTKVFVLLLALFIAACSRPIQSDHPQSTVVGPGEESVPFAYRPGYGVVQSVWRVESPAPSAAAAAGGTVGRVVGGVAFRLIVRMDDGTTQTVLQDSPEFKVGDRVELTRDGRVLRV